MKRGRLAHGLLSILAAVALAAVAASAQGEVAAPRLGRLFFTETERQALDYARDTRDRVATSAPESPPEVAPASRKVTINGLVKPPASRPATAWINSQMQEPGQQAELKVLANPQANRVPVLLTGSGALIELKVGQTWLPDSGAILDAYQMGPAPGPEATPTDPTGATDEPRTNAAPE